MYIIGIDPTQVWLAPASGVVPPQFTEGQLAANSAGNIFMFGKASAAISTANLLCQLGTGGLTGVNTTNSAPGTGQGRICGVNMAVLVSGGFGWFQVFGIGSVRVLASCAANTTLNSTGTAGALDDDATAGSEVITGVALSAANGGAAATVACWLSWPSVGRTL